MIYPATYDIVILQNATWSATFRATQDRKKIQTINVDAGIPTFLLSCHGRSAGDKVVFTGGDVVPCGLALNTIYYVISDGLTEDSFRVAAESGGSSIVIEDPPTGIFYVARPINITGFTIDADIVREITTSTSTTLVRRYASFEPTLSDPVNGVFKLVLPPETSISLATGDYFWDVSLTSGEGERYYWIKGKVTVQRTYSRLNTLFEEPTNA